MNPAPAMQSLPGSADYIRFLPEIVLSLFGIAIMLLDPLLDEERSQKIPGGLGLAGTLAALLATRCMSRYPGTGFWNMIRVDDFSVFFHYLIIAIAALTILISYEYLSVQR